MNKNLPAKVLRLALLDLFTRDLSELVAENDPKTVKQRKMLAGIVKELKNQRDLRKCKKTLALIGCTVDELRNHIESQFKPGMN